MIPDRVHPERPTGNESNRHVTIRMSDLKPEPVDWIWVGRIPVGEITLLDGDPGLGKSTLLIDIAARLSTGREMPDGSPGPAAAGTVLLTCEDDYARVVVPRLLAASADTSKIVAVQRTTDGDLSDVSLTKADLRAVGVAASEAIAGLIVIDPLMAFLPSDVNPYNDQEVRQALLPVRNLARSVGRALLRFATSPRTPNDRRSTVGAAVLPSLPRRAWGFSWRRTLRSPRTVGSSRARSRIWRREPTRWHFASSHMVRPASR